MAELYRHYDAEGRLLYVGISWSAVVRYANGHRKVAEWAGDVAQMTVERFDTRADAEAAEQRAIREENPLHNVQHVARPKEKRQAKAARSEPFLFPHTEGANAWAPVHRPIIYAPNGVSDAVLAFWGAHPAHIYKSDSFHIVRGSRRGDSVVQVGSRLSDATLAQLRWEGVRCYVI